MSFYVQILHNDDPLFTLVITADFKLHHLKMADQDPAIGSLYADRSNSIELPFYLKPNALYL